MFATKRWFHKLPSLVSYRLLLAAVVLVCSSASIQAAPKSQLWSVWEAHDNASTTSVEHGEWSDFLSKYRRQSDDGDVGVAYDEVSEADHTQLGEYLQMLQAVPVKTLSREEQLAYWINLYNATTVKVVLDDWPVNSIRDIKEGLLSGGPWKAQRLTIEGEKVSLNDIEHRILRPIWRDPRLHYALNCASIGCPDLLATAFTRDNSERLLNDASINFINHPRAATVSDGKLVVSSIYHWFKEDFNGDDSGVLAHLREHANAELTQALESITSIKGHEYDWSINLTN